MSTSFDRYLRDASAAVAMGTPKPVSNLASAVDSRGLPVHVGDKVQFLNPSEDDHGTLTVVRIGTYDDEPDLRLEGDGVGDGVWCLARLVKKVSETS